MPGREQDDRLVDHLEPVAGDGPAQIVLEAEAVAHARVHRLVEHLVARLAARLGVIHRRVGVAHHFVGIVVVRRPERDADARGREHLAAADRERQAERFLDPERDGVGLRVVVQAAEQDGELVAAEPRDGVAGTQAGLEAARRLDEQLVADQVAEAVVDDLEAIEIEVEDRERVADAAQPELFEPAAEAFDEHRAVVEAGERIEEADAAQPLLGDRLLGRIGQRAGDADALAAAAADRDAAAQEAAIAAVLVADAVLVLEHLRLPGEMRFELLAEIDDVVGMHALEPGLRPSSARLRREPDHRPPAARDVELLRLQVPLPEAVVGPFGSQRQPLTGAFELVLGVGPLGDVVPQQRDTLGDRDDLDLQDPRPCRHRDGDLRDRACLAVAERFLDGARAAPCGRRQARRARAAGRARARAGSRRARSAASFQSVTQPSRSSTDMPCSRNSITSRR